MDFCPCCENRLVPGEVVYCDDCVWVHGRRYYDTCEIWIEKL